MVRQRIVCAMDIGTTKVCTLIAQLSNSHSLNLIGISIVPSRGLRKGVVVDVNATVSALSESMHRAERMAGVQVRRVIAGITGHHIQCYNTHAVISVTGEEQIVTDEHVQRLLQEAKMLAQVPEDHQILHVVPRQFILDGQEGVHQPVGMHGRRLAVDAHVVSVGISFLRNLEECIRRAELEVAEMVLEPLAASEAVLTDADRELGAALLDIGGGTTDIAIFVNGSIAYSRALPIGGNHVTQDLSIGLRTPFHEAEALKQQHGCALERMVNDDEIVEVKMVGSTTPRQLPRRIVAQIIEPRMRELFELVYQVILDSGFADNLAAGIVLTGGGSLLTGTLDLAREVMELPVRVGVPVALGGLSETLRSPIYATSVGLLLYATKWYEREPQQPAESPWEHFINILRELWGRLRIS